MAFSYNKKNLANTTITGAITSSDTSITVDDATVFPSGYFYATLMPSSEMSTFSNSEIVLVTNISSNTLTIARGQKSTTARAFSAGAIITNGVYTEDLDFAQSVGKKIFSAAWGGQSSPYYKITDDMLKVVPDEGTSIRAIFDTDYASGTARLSINESTSGVVTVSGSSISITDAENLAPVDVKLKGDTEQTTSSGKNMYPGSQDWSGTWTNSSHWTTDSSTHNGLVVKKNDGAWDGMYKQIQVTSGKTYTFSLYMKSDVARQTCIYITTTGSASVDNPYFDITTTTGWVRYSTTFKATSTGNIMARLENKTSITGSYTYICGYQLEEGSSMSAYEPYTGGTASPNPDYPQAIQTVTGEQTITISDGGSGSEEFKINLGKNLWVDSTTLGQGGWNFASGGWFNDTKYVGSGYVSVQPNTTYTISASAGITAGGGVLYFNGTTYLGYKINPAGGTFTTPSNCNRIKYDFYNTDGLTVSEVTNIQLEEGSTATTYAPYFTPIELCKLGTYQDYIYKDNGNWYIHKETASYTFTGNENCDVWNGGVQCRFGDNTNPQSSLYNEDIVPIYRPQTTGTYPIYSDKAVAGTEISTWLGDTRTVAYASRQNTNYGAILFSFSAAVADTREEFLNILAGTRVVYIRAAATDTQITDSTLISQLNALANNKLYAGTNNIVVAGGLDGILEVQYYRSGTGVNTVPIVNGAYVADDNTRNVAPVKAGIPYDLTYHSGNWYVMNMVKQITADDIDFTTYSTEEQVVGTWIDGKPIYRKVLAGTASATNIGVPVGENNISKFIFIDAYRLTAGANSDTIGQFYSNTNDFFKFWGRESSNHNFSIELRNSTANYDYTIIVEYTKTTDTAQQTRSVTDSETDNEAVEEEPIEEPVEEQQNR